MSSQVYTKKITETIPSFFHTFIPNESNDAVLIFEKEQRENEYSDVMIIIDRMKEKYDNEKMYQLLYKSNHIVSTGKILNEVFIHALLYTGRKTLEHLKKLVERYLTILTDILSDKENQTIALKSIYNVWNEKPQIKVLVVDKFMTFTLLESEIIIDWIFKQIKNSNCKEMNKVEWDIMFNVINKMIMRSSSIEKDLNNDEEYSDKNEFEINEKKDSLIKALETVVVEEGNMFTYIYKSFIDVILFYEALIAKSNDNESDEDRNISEKKRFLEHIKQRFMQFGRKYINNTKKTMNEIEIYANKVQNNMLSELLNNIKSIH